MMDTEDLKRNLEKQIAELPAGYISYKNINGRKRAYLQWREDGRIRSKYIRPEDEPYISERIARRHDLQEELRELKERKPAIIRYGFEANVKTGKDLAAMAENTRKLSKRDSFPLLMQFLKDSDNTKVFILYGLRRTGKTTMMLQAIGSMDAAAFSQAAYIKMQAGQDIAMLVRDIERLYRRGYRYIFIDEATLMKDFIDTAATLSDIYAMMGMKLVLSGTDSLGFRLAGDNELYDRAWMIHTTFIPYREYSRLLGIDDIDEYIRYGGTLRRGETAFEDKELQEESIAFRDDESTRRYIDTAISRNIQHSLANFDYGHYLGPLRVLYEAGELTGATNRIIEDMNHRFVLQTLTSPFVSHDLGIASRNLRNERSREKRTDILDTIDTEAVTERLMRILEIRNKEEQLIGITQSHAALIRRYLEELDLIAACPIEYGTEGVEPEERIIFTQPGMRYCQAEALVHSLFKDPHFLSFDDETKEYASGRILEEVRGRMLEDIILLETMKSLGRRYKVFKLQFITGEYDMVIRDTESNACALYEVKHSGSLTIGQARHLLDADKLSIASRRYGRIAGRFVLYLGNDIDTEQGIAYRNASSFLRNLPGLQLESGLER